MNEYMKRSEAFDSFEDGEADVAGDHVSPAKNRIRRIDDKTASKMRGQMKLVSVTHCVQELGNSSTMSW